VTLRRLPAAPWPELSAAVDLARSVAHPKLAKTLGVQRAGDTWYLASEYIAGVTLFELGQVLVSRGERLDAHVAVKVTLDMLDAAIAARELLLVTANARSVRCIHRESVWVADFGETFLSEVSVSTILSEAGGAGGPDTADSPESRDIRSAGLLLLELAGGSSVPSALEDPTIPDALRRIAARASGLRNALPYPSLRAFADALLELGPSAGASHDEVSAELHRLMGSLLETRRQKLAMTERVSLQESEQDETKFFRAASTHAQRDTARPPADPVPQRPDHITHSEKYRIPPRSEPPDDPTSIFRRPDLQRKNHTPPELSRELPRVESNVPSRRARAVETQASPEPVQPASLVASKSSQVTRRRLAVALLLLAALVAFAATSTQSAALHDGKQTSLTHSGLRWLQSQAGKVGSWFR